MKRLFWLVLSLFCFLVSLSCSPKPQVREIIDPATPGINLQIKEALSSGKSVVVVMGTGLCANCKIVAEIVNTLKETRKDLDVSWVVYEDYRDQATFKAFHLTISPTTYLISPSHEVMRRLTGTYSQEDLLDALKEEGLIP